MNTLTPAGDNARRLAEELVAARHHPPPIVPAETVTAVEAALADPACARALFKALDVLRESLPPADPLEFDDALFEKVRGGGLAALPPGRFYQLATNSSALHEVRRELYGASSPARRGRAPDRLPPEGVEDTLSPEERSRVEALTGRMVEFVRSQTAPTVPAVVATVVREAADDPVPVASRGLEPPGSRHGGPLWRYAIPAGGLAASLLIGGVGYWLGTTARGPDQVAKGPPGQIAVEAARARQFGGDPPEPNFVAPVGGFVVAVALTAGGEARVWPADGDRPGEPVAVRAGESVRVGPLGRDVERVVVVVTEQAAGAELHRALHRRRLSPADLPIKVTATLDQLKIRVLAVGAVDYPLAR